MKIKSALKHERKTLWQFIKFLLVSGIAGILQIILVNLLCWALADWKAPLPGFLTGIFSASVVGAGNDNWGYVFPFFASNLLANIYGYIQNKEDYIQVRRARVVLCGVSGADGLPDPVLNMAARRNRERAALDRRGAVERACADDSRGRRGDIQMAVLFPVEKFVLLKEKKE